MNSLPALILSLFAGRRDVIAVGNGDGFAPELSRITEDRLVREHLGATRCLGFYLLDSDSRCRCSCVDFDNKPDKPNPAWKEQAEALYFALLGCGIRPVVELSQSGSGCHVWMFFVEPVDAWLPRAWWRAVSLKTGIHFVEVYPRQDWLTGKGYGNLVRYPLWNASCFVDPEDGWKILDAVETLASVVRIDPVDLRLIAFQSGMGNLEAPPRAEETLIVGADGIISARVRRLISQEGTLVAKRWAGDSVGMSDTSRSAVAMSLCCELVRAYVPTPEIGAALRAWCREQGTDKGERDDWINRTVTKAYDYILEKKEVRSSTVSTFRDACHAYIDRIENGSTFHVPSGIAELDASIDGVAPGEVAIIAGRPGHGKSAVGFQWIDNAAGLGVAALCISEEMGMLEIGKRRLASVAAVPQTHWVAAAAASMRRDVDGYHANRAPVYIVESVSSIDRAEEVIDQFCQLYNVGIVMVDYLQLLGSRKGDRYEVVTEVSRRIKQAARRNYVPVLLLSQLNRSVEHRDDNEPKLSDLRESGQVEQDADLVIFAQYPCKFDNKAADDLYRLVCAKRRNGPIRSARVETRFNPHKQFIGFPNVPIL